MNISKEEKKIKAIEIMKQLEIYIPYIQDFEKENIVCYFENFAGFWTFQNEELEQKIKVFEKERNAVVYAVTHEYTTFGECYSFLYVPDYKEDWDFIIQSNNNNHIVLAYVWNKDFEENSECGDICIHSFGGGIRRIG